MAIKICCNKCESTKVKEIDKRCINSHIEVQSGFFGLGGSYDTRRIRHNEYEYTYGCEECGYEF